MMKDKMTMINYENVNVSSFWDSLDESIILTVFVLPKYHGMGIGRKIMQVLEQDEF